MSLPQSLAPSAPAPSTSPENLESGLTSGLALASLPHQPVKVIHQEPNLDIAEVVTELILLPAVLRAALYPFHQTTIPAVSKMPTAAIMMTTELTSDVAVSSRKNLLRPFIPVPLARISSGSS